EVVVGPAGLVRRREQRLYEEQTARLDGGRDRRQQPPVEKVGVQHQVVLLCWQLCTVQVDLPRPDTAGEPALLRGLSEVRQAHVADIPAVDGVTQAGEIERVAPGAAGQVQRQ